jgi:hypothetical protein
MHKLLELQGIKDDLYFPGRLLFSNFSPSALMKRMHKLEVYLNNLAQRLNLLDCYQACDFLGIDSWSKELLTPSKDNTEILSLTSDSQKELLCIQQFLRLLSLKPVLLSSTVKAFETLCSDNALKFTKVEIELLLRGDEKYEGLLFHCGEHENPIGANSCLNFLVKLLKYEYNSIQADKFREVYANTNPKVIKQMDLGLHIRKALTKEYAGFFAVYLYLNSNVYSIIEADDLLLDETAINQYNNWIKLKQINGYLPKTPVKQCINKTTRSNSKGSTDTEESDYSQMVLSREERNKTVMEIA